MNGSDDGGLPFDIATSGALRARLGDFPRLDAESSGLKRAAVAIAIVRDGEQCAVLITRRAAGLRGHAGQWALPGGRLDAGETAPQAALREMHEEVNLELDTTAILGTLDDYQTRSGFCITPIVIWADTDWRQLVPNPDEVESIHLFTFAELARADSPHLEHIPQSDQQVLCMHYGDDCIFAPTGAMLYQFREIALFGRVSRVAHYDQPVFAWS